MVEIIEQSFDLIMITDKLDESLIIFRNDLCLTWEEIRLAVDGLKLGTQTVKNIFPPSTPKSVISEKMLQNPAIEKLIIPQLFQKSPN